MERVLHGNLSQFSFLMSILHEKARELDLKPSYTAYMRWGKGPKQPLRFSKFGGPKVERQYATHYVANKHKIAAAVAGGLYGACSKMTILACVTFISLVHSV
ncbi:hypothetical protein [Paenibacillus cineris]|uniref:hypothetical protein n=1 Tax=Paenibacillus cineris TaxID=237530 RepID=UPI001B1D35A2|nr:hypothetical protein [Paenibacillus cineris]GIO61591.1 hypothetical protein J43TS9_31650 [Paenibacillus cineris]